MNEFYLKQSKIIAKLKTVLHSFIEIKREDFLICLKIGTTTIIIHPSSKDGKTNIVYSKDIIFIEDKDYELTSLFLNNKTKQGTDHTPHFFSLFKNLKKTNSRKEIKKQFQHFPNLNVRMFLKEKFKFKEDPNKEYFLFGNNESRKRYYFMDEHYDKSLKVTKNGLKVKIIDKSALLFNSKRIKGRRYLDIDMAPYRDQGKFKKMENKVLILKKNRKEYYFEDEKGPIYIGHPDLLIEVLD